MAVPLRVTIVPHRKERADDIDPRTFDLLVDDDQNIRTLKDQIQSEAKIPFNLQQAIYQDHLCDNSWVLNSLPNWCSTTKKEDDPPGSEDAVLLKKNMHQPANSIVIVIKKGSRQADVKAGADEGDDGGSGKDADDGEYKYQDAPYSAFLEPSWSRTLSTSSSWIYERELSPLPSDPLRERELLGKVYTTLFVQISATVLLCFFGMYMQSFQDAFVANEEYLKWSCLSVGVIALAGMHYTKERFPFNLFWYLLFVSAQAIVIGLICALLSNGGIKTLILEIFIYTFSTLTILSASTTVSRVDFQWLGPFLFAALIVLLLWCITTAIVGFDIRSAYAMLGVLGASGYILYDTRNIVRTYRSYDHGEFLIICIEHYLDLINIILYVPLCMLGIRR
uniref:Uncharacterized protein n=1 Tax=Lotharella oceanica TaxID=641309 RepID=A0A7S2U2Q6_9EUKA|mmetsp:Transcript_7517/g.14693  ORF Transcript_7517/g.14693 Transcript_7517/m.14693 type:complete len:393 (+) Transcript_7517:2-1180(+)